MIIYLLPAINYFGSQGIKYEVLSRVVIRALHIFDLSLEDSVDKIKGGHVAHL